MNDMDDFRDDPCYPKAHSKLRKMKENSSYVNKDETCEVIEAKLNLNEKQNSLVDDDEKWTATDDLMLINNIEHIKNISIVHQAVQFSSYFTRTEVEQRWHSLLYNKVISSDSQKAISRLPPSVVDDYNKKTLFSDEEEDILKSIPSHSNNNIEFFQVLLEKNSVFHFSRSAKRIMEHWKLMGHFHLLCDQSVSCEVSLSDIESEAKSNYIESKVEKNSERKMNEHKISHQHFLMELHQAEKDFEKSQKMMKLAGLSLEKTDKNVIGVLQGKKVRYLMQTDEITFGRSTLQESVDIDLSLEGPANKISRKQGQIKTSSKGLFDITNTGKKVIYVDGKALSKGSSTKICNNSVIEIAALKFVFYIN